jgi:hypothetical protein
MSYDYRIEVEESEDGEAQYAKVAYLEDGKVVGSESFVSTFEDVHSARDMALSSAGAWLETVTYSFEERLGPFGIEWEREQEGRGR